MAKKTKKIKAAKRRAMPAVPRPAQPATNTSPALARPAEGPRRPGTRGPIAEGSAIPLERVPYFKSDLQRIAITVGIMFVLIVIGSVTLPNLLSSVFR